MAAATHFEVNKYPDVYTFFWRKDSPFSQWYLAKFTVDGILYNCAEQYMMHQKALLMGDDDVADQIMQTDDPKEQKNLGRKVKNFDADLWNKKCVGIVKEGNKHKFGQSKSLKKIMFETRGTTLVEASPVDTIWGIGLAESNADSRDRSLWKGQNLLGYALTDVRDELIEKETEPIKTLNRNPADYPTNYVFFWRTESPFSQWHSSEFEVDGVKYNCAEQYMMHQKALLMGDDATADEVMNTKKPRAQKSLGRKVRNFSEELWNAHCYDIVKKGNFHKFNQNEDLKKIILETDGKTLVEASPQDKIWGIGLEAEDPRAKNYKTWNGKNLLGFALTDAREQIKNT